MNRRLIYVCLCITLLSFFSCSKEYDDSIKDLQAVINKGAIKEILGGIYVGAWWINGEKVEDGSSGVCFTPRGLTNWSMLSFSQAGFPSESVFKRLFPDTDFSELSIELASGGFILLRDMGFSEKMTYYSLLSDDGEAYVQHQLQVTDKSDHRFMVMLDYVPSESTVSLDFTLQTLSIGLVVKRIEIIDETGNNTVRELNPEMKLTFIGTRKND